MSISQEDVIIEVEDDNTMDIENAEDNEDPEEDFLTKVKNNIPDLVRNAGIAGMELSSNNYVIGAGSVLHLVGDLFSSANDSKTRKDLNLLKQRTTDVKEREKRCQENEERVFEREKRCQENQERVFEREKRCQENDERNFERENICQQIEERIFEREKRCQENEKRVFDREKNVFEREKQNVMQMKEILQTVKTTKDKRARADENEEDTPQAKRYDGEERIKCQCGSDIRKSDLARHFRTLKHQDYKEKNE